MDAESPNTFQILLERLDSDPDKAAEKYLNLHLKLTKTLIYNRCRESDAENVADKVLDRVAQKIIDIEAKLAQGITKEKKKVKGKVEEVEIKPIESIPAYSLTVMRFMLLEYFRENPLPPDDDPVEQGAEDDDWLNLDDPDVRIRCLRKCMAEKLNDADKDFILAYYGYREEKEEEEKAKQRTETNGPPAEEDEPAEKTGTDDNEGQKLKVIREKLRIELGLSKSNFKKKACVLRQRLETCIKGCVEKINGNQIVKSDTH